jgi:hypothetical protein
MKYTLLSLVLGLSLAISLGANANLAGATTITLYGADKMNDAPILYADNNLINYKENNGGCAATDSNFENNSGWYPAGFVNYSSPYVRKTAGLFKFNFADIPINSVVDSVVFSFYHYIGNEGETCGGKTFDVSARRLSGSWSEGSLCGSEGSVSWRYTSGSNIWSSGDFSETDLIGGWLGSGSYVSGSLGRQNMIFGELGLNTVNGWINGTIINNGFVITAYNETEQITYCSYNYGLKENGTYDYIPRLEVTYHSSEPPPIPYNLTAEERVCLDDEILIYSDYGYTTAGVAILNQKYVKCSYGCLNFTITGLGAAGCAETPLQSALLFMVALVGVIAVLAWLNKR